MNAVTVASAILLAVAAGAGAWSVRYVLAREFMPYHAQLVGLDWRDIPRRYQLVTLGMLKMVGAGLLALGAGIAWLVAPFSRGEPWASWAIPSLVCTRGFVSTYVTVALRRVDPGASTNVITSCSGVVLALAALALAHGSDDMRTPRPAVGGHDEKSGVDGAVHHGRERPARADRPRRIRFHADVRSHLK